MSYNKKYNPFIKPLASLVLLLPALFCSTSFFSCTKDLPRLMKVQNDSIADIAITTAKIYTTVIDIGEGTDQYGHCWSVEDNPTLDNCENSTALGSIIKPGQFTESLTNLSINTIYYVKAYLKKGDNVVYSNSLSFNTLMPTLPVVSTAGVTGITVNSCTCGGNVSSEGATTVTARGVCWSTSTGPTILNDRTTDGSGTGSFVSAIAGLSSNTGYFVRAYATNSMGTAYGPDVSFKTAAVTTKPTLTTTNVSNRTTISATSGGSTINDGGEPITSKGVCWSTSSGPILTDAHTSDGSGTGDFVSIISGLSPGTLYYVKAYAVNSKGTGYGQEVSFRTTDVTTLPTVITTSMSNITFNSAISGGSIPDDGGETITAKGVCWSINTNPTVSDYFTSEGGSPGTFTSAMTGLDPLTTYYVKAYATNVNGTAYGLEVNFTTDFNCGTQFLDPRDEKLYNTVIIGNQCWMTQNLNIGTQINGTEDQTDNILIEKYCYENQESNCDIYGGIYQWDEMMQYTTIESTQGVCPGGWHLPSDYEWKVMEMAIGMSKESADSFYWRGTTEGGKLKVPGTYYWDSPNTGATNSTLFTALPAGWVSSKVFVEKGYSAVFWTSSPTIGVYSWYRYLTADQSKIYRRDGYRPNGTSVRCIRNPQ
jgi:uncharacterized protein (TIGR02145 family)